MRDLEHTLASEPRQVVLETLHQLAVLGKSLGHELPARFAHDPAVRWGLRRLQSGRLSPPAGAVSCEKMVLACLEAGKGEGEVLLTDARLYAAYRDEASVGLVQVDEAGQALKLPLSQGDWRVRLHALWEGRPVLTVTRGEAGRTFLFQWKDGFQGLTREGSGWRCVAGQGDPLGAGVYQVWVDDQGSLQAEKDFCASPHYEAGDPVPHEFLRAEGQCRAARERLPRAQAWEDLEFHSELWTFGEWRVFGVPQWLVDNRLLRLDDLRYFRAARAAEWQNLLILWVEAISCAQGRNLLVLKR